jgi:hypothetical protein
MIVVEDLKPELQIQHFLCVMRYKNPTPNPIPASDEGAKMYLIKAKTAVIITDNDK